MAIVKIKPIEREKWHGKKGNESFTRPTTIRALVNVDSMTYATGLTEEEAKEYGEKLKIDLSKWKDRTSYIWWYCPAEGEFYDSKGQKTVVGERISEIGLEAPSKGKKKDWVAIISGEEKIVPVEHNCYYSFEETVGEQKVFEW